MRRWHLAGLIVTVAIAALLYPIRARTYPKRVREADAARQIALARQAEIIIASRPVIDTVVRLVTRTQTLRDTVLARLTDTAYVTRYVYQTDTLRVACERCARQLATLIEASEATNRAADLHVASLQRELARQKRKNVLQRFGVSCGYGGTVAQGQVYAGPQCGVSVRVLP